MNSLEANIRDNQSKGQLNTLRKNGNVPAIIYGGKKQNEVKFLNHIKNIIDTNSTNAEAIMVQYQKDKNFFNINEK